MSGLCSQRVSKKNCYLRSNIIKSFKSHRRRNKQQLYSEKEHICLAAFAECVLFACVSVGTSLSPRGKSKTFFPVENRTGSWMSSLTTLLRAKNLKPLVGGEVSLSSLSWFFFFKGNCSFGNQLRGSSQRRKIIFLTLVLLICKSLTRFNPSTEERSLKATVGTNVLICSDNCAEFFTCFTY